MCDYSLHHVNSRPAKIGDRLTTRNFGLGTRGCAASEEKYLEHVPPELNSVGFPGRSGWQILSALIRFWERERCRRPTLLIFEVE